MKIFLDDDTLRTKVAEDKIGCVIVSTVTECIEKIKQETQEKSIEVLFLDHDLGGTSYQDSDDPESAMEVVRWLENNSMVDKIELIIVHSHNRFAAPIMVSRLDLAGYTVSRLPFRTLKKIVS